MQAELNSSAGLTAAIATALSWTTAAVIFQSAVRSTPNAVINFIRVVIALALLIPTAFFMRGHALPFDISLTGWMWMIASSLVGFVACDYLLFESFVLTGARTSMVIFSLAPVFAAAGGWIFLNETIPLKGIIGIIVTLFGVILATTGKPRPKNDEKSSRTHWLGIAAASAASIFQGIGYLLSRQAMQYCDSVGGTQIRMISAILGFGLVMVFRRESKAVITVWTERKSAIQMGVGSLIGTYLGMVLSLYALANVQSGIAGTIFALTPVLMIPPMVIIYRDKVTLMEIGGAITAVAGVILLVS